MNGEHRTMRPALLAILVTVVVAVTLPTSASDLEGRVISVTTKQGLPGVSVQVLDETLEPLPDAGTLTGDDGTYVIPDLPDGRDLHVTYRLESYLDYPHSESCRLPDTPRLDVLLMPANPTPTELRDLFTRIQGLPSAELAGAWRALDSFDLRSEARNLIQEQALDVLGEAKVHRVEQWTSISFAPVDTPPELQEEMQDMRRQLQEMEHMDAAEEDADDG